MENVLGSGCITVTTEKICYSYKECLIFIDGEEVKVFGVYANLGDELLDRICDVHTDEKLVRGLCKMLNDNEVSILHFNDVVYDWVVEMCL